MLYFRYLDIGAVSFLETFHVDRHFFTFQARRNTSDIDNHICIFDFSGSGGIIDRSTRTDLEVEVSATRALHIFDLDRIFLSFFRIQHIRLFCPVFVFPNFGYFFISDKKAEGVVS